MAVAKGTSRGIYAEEFSSGLIQHTVKLAAGHRCEQCDMQFHADSNLAVSATNAVGKPMIGTVHHINYDPNDSRLANLVFLCQACHCQTHGVQWEPGKQIPLVWKGNLPAWIIERGLPYINHPQLALPWVFA